jgi:hypothetical protein
MRRSRPLLSVPSPSPSPSPSSSVRTPSAPGQAHRGTEAAPRRLRIGAAAPALALLLLAPVARAEAGAAPRVAEAAAGQPAGEPPVAPDPQGAPPAGGAAAVAPAAPISLPSIQSAPPQAADVPALPAAPAAPGPSLPEWTRSLTIGGGTILWYYQPFLSGAKNTVDLFFVNLLLDGKVGDFGLHVEPRFRDTKLRPHFAGMNGGTAWVQEVYASWKLPGATLKIGKAYSHLGLFWDNSFYGNVQVYDGLKLDPDYGLSLEGAVAEGNPIGAHYWAQFFLVDGQTNVALEGRETFMIPGARRRNQAILRIEPFFDLPIGLSSAASTLKVKVGLSGEFLQADLPAPVGKKDVYRGAADLTVTAGPVSLWSEFIRQNGQTVTDFPIAGVPATATTPATPGQASAHTNYFLVGAELALGKVSARYNVSYGGYRDLSISEWMHVPAIGVAVCPNVTFLGEYVYWKRYAPAGDLLVDKSFNLTLQAHF